MSNERAKTALEVFEAALGIPPDDRATWVEQAVQPRRGVGCGS